jgi:protein-disulfide isomerase
VEKGVPQYLFSFALVGFAWLTSGYLLLRALQLGGGAPIVRVVGVPLAGWGVVYFALLGFLLALGGPSVTRATVLLAGAGAGASLVLTSALLLSWAPFCPLCLLVHASSFALFPAVWRLGEPERHRARGRSPASLLRWKYLPVAAMAAGALLQGGLFTFRGLVGDGIDLERVLAVYQSAPQQDVVADSSDPFLGSADAPVRLVVFSSFQCPGCQTFARWAGHLSKRFDGRLQIIFKHYPLGKACHSAMLFDTQPRSCAAAWAAEAAHRQKAFWSYHDGLFASDLLAKEEKLRRLAGQVGLDEAQFESARHSDEVHAKVRSDIELGHRLGVDGTPAIFINGRRVREFNLAVLGAVVNHELRSQQSR